GEHLGKCHSFAVNANLSFFEGRYLRGLRLSFEYSLVRESDAALDLINVDDDLFTEHQSQHPENRGAQSEYRHKTPRSSFLPGAKIIRHIVPVSFHSLPSLSFGRTSA